jgi:hypothetical protein
VERLETEDQYDLPDTALVVRGGEMNLTNLSASAEAEYAETGEYALSFWASADLDVGGIVRAARHQGELTGDRNIPHGRVQVSTAGRIRAAGFDLVATPPPGHYSLVLPDPPTVADYAAVMSAFDSPVPNPEGRMV